MFVVNITPKFLNNPAKVLSARAKNLSEFKLGRSFKKWLILHRTYQLKKHNFLLYSKTFPNFLIDIKTLESSIVYKF